MPEKRQLEDTDGGRFWEIWSDGDTVYTRSGKAGSDGQTKLKQVADVAAEIQKQVEKKLVEGFVEKGGGPPAPKLDAKELKAHLKNVATDDGAYLVLADWLQQQAHPWGELIALQHAAASGKKAATLTKQAEKHLTLHKSAILGSLAQRLDGTWDRGFLRRAQLGVEPDPKAIVKAIKALAALPPANLLEAIAIDPSPESFKTWRDSSSSRDHVVQPWSDLEAVVAALPDRVKHVGFGGWPVNAAAAYVEMPTFTAVTKACAELTTVELTGTAPDKLGKLSLPVTTDLRVHFANANGTAIEALSSAKLPKLERFEIWLGGESHVIVDSVHDPAEWEEDMSGLDRYPPTFSAEDLGNMETYDIDVEVDAEALATLLAAKWTATLKHLALGAPTLSAELVDALVEAPLLARLESLALSGLEDPAALAKAKKSFAHLTTFDLSGNSLPEAAIEKLKKAFPSAQLPAASADIEPFLFRFVATME